MTRVLLVDDDPLVRMGLRLVLGADPELEVVGEAADGAAALDAVRALHPDVVLMDLRMPGTDGLAATAALHETADPATTGVSGARPAVLVLTTFDTDDHVLRALRAGAAGFLVKDTPPRDIITAVHKAAAGEAALSPRALAALIGHVVGDGDRHGDPERSAARQERAARARAALGRLTDREREVAFAIAEGRSNQEIAASMFVSVATVKAHVTRILAELGCVNRVQVAIAVHEARE